MFQFLPHPTGELFTTAQDHQELQLQTPDPGLESNLCITLLPLRHLVLPGGVGVFSFKQKALQMRMYVGPFCCQPYAYLKPEK